MNTFNCVFIIYQIDEIVTGYNIDTGDERRDITQIDLGEAQL